MIKRVHLQFALVLALAGLLTLLKVPLASSQGLQLLARYTQDDLPLADPDSATWNDAAAVEIPLSAQNISKPFLLDAKVQSVTARALLNDRQLAVLVEWADATEDKSSVAVQDFRDAAALQYPVTQGQPFFCMGQQGGDVNIWHWKADWQAELLARREMEEQYPDMYVDDYPFAQASEGEFAQLQDYTDQDYLPALAAENLFASLRFDSPVEDLVAGGFGSLTAQPLEGQNVQGFGVWQEGRWRVIFSRDLQSPDPEDVSFLPGNPYSIALAVWDGSNSERNGQKSTSQWINLQLGNAPTALTLPAEQAVVEPTGWASTRNLTTMLIVGFGLVVAGILVVYFRLPE